MQDNRRLMRTAFTVMALCLCVQVIVGGLAAGKMIPQDIDSFLSTVSGFGWLAGYAVGLYNLLLLKGARPVYWLFGVAFVVVWGFAFAHLMRALLLLPLVVLIGVPLYFQSRPDVEVASKLIDETDAGLPGNSE